jgi:AcrR family transcriptional regulator
MMLRYHVNMGRNRLHGEATATALLEAAERIVEADGLDALTVRCVAERTGTTTRAVYSTFGSKEALLSGLGVRAFDMLGAIVDALPETDDPGADLVAAGAAGFRRFALAHPALFRLGIQQTAVPSTVAATIVPAAERALVALHRRISRAGEAGALGGRSLSDATWEFHSLCEGLAANELRCHFTEADGHRLWTDALGSLIAGWAAQHRRGRCRGEPDGRPA